MMIYFIKQGLVYHPYQQEQEVILSPYITIYSSMSSSSSSSSTNDSRSNRRTTIIEGGTSNASTEIEMMRQQQQHRELRIRKNNSTTGSSNTTGNSNSSMTIAIRILALVFVLVVSIVLLLSPKNNNAIEKATTATTIIPTAPTNSTSAEVIAAAAAAANVNKKNTGQNVEDVLLKIGTIEQIPYYYCSSKKTSSSVSKLSTNAIVSHYTIVLLHGSIFTKEDWKTSGILNLLCTDNNDNNNNNANNNKNIIIDVYALDLPITASYQQLRSILHEISNIRQQQNQQSNKGQIATIITAATTVLVTPSASGTMIYDWFQQKIDNDKNNEIEHIGLSLDIQKYIHYWIPVACNKLLTLPTIDNISWLDIQHDGPQIIAIYGDEDVAGKRSSELLHQKMHTTKVYELPGRHPVYLDVPDQFVSLLLKSIIV